jgi:hypothetical protein
MSRLRNRKSQDTDFSDFIPAAPQTRKERLLRECERRGVSVYVDDSSEASVGVYADLRAVASEAELERRLQATTAAVHAKYATVIAVLSLVVSIVSLVRSFF